MTAALVAIGITIFPLTRAEATETYSEYSPTSGGIHLGFGSPSDGLDFCAFTVSMMRAPSLAAGQAFDYNGYATFTWTNANNCWTFNTPKNAPDIGGASLYSIRVVLYNRDTVAICASIPATVIPIQSSYGIGAPHNDSCGDNYLIQTELINLWTGQIADAELYFAK